MVLVKAGILGGHKGLPYPQGHLLQGYRLPVLRAGQHGGERVAIHKVSSLSLFYNNRIWHAAAIRQSKNPAKVFAGFLAF